VSSVAHCSCSKRRVRRTGATDVKNLPGMDHLRAPREFGSIGIAVPLVTQKIRCTPIRSLEDFYNFPGNNGWSVEKEKYALSNNALGGSKSLLKSELLQSWLFFGLISFVVQGQDGPLLEFEDLLDEESLNLDFLSTQKLPKALDDWEQWEMKNKETAKVRMVRAELALEYAHRIVRKNCAFDSEDSEGAQSPSPNDPDFLGDEVALSLMVLGELLTAAKARIISKLNSKMRGWHKDDERGWGPPGYVIKQMKGRKWCPRTIHLLQGQLGSNATLLLAAFETHKLVEISDVHVRRRCTKDACMVISEDGAAEHPLNQEAPQDGPKSKYEPKHVIGCPGTGCPMVGPEMDRVYQILRAQNNNNEDRRFPVLEVHENCDGNLEMLVGEWTQGQDIPFATISHVWSDGLGNEDKNQISYCQFKFISSLLKKVTQSSPNDQEEPGIRMIPFWLDTLLIPVRSTEADLPDPGDFDELKRKAIRQIYEIFRASTHCIVIDRGLLSIDSSGTPWKNVMKIFGSGWMRRLWTLQEAYLSKDLWITFQQGAASHKGMHNFDSLIEKMVSKVTLETFGASMGEMAGLKLFQNIMGFERNQLKDDEDPQESGGAILVANTWRAARWRVSHLPLT
jgi:hypothetical protein